MGLPPRTRGTKKDLVIGEEYEETDERGDDDDKSAEHLYDYPRKLLAGKYDEKIGWYLLYAKGTNEIVGEVQLGLLLV